MGTRKHEINYNCDNDCWVSGCPGHELNGTLQSTSDFITIENEKGEYIFRGDINKTKALLVLLKKLDCHNVYFNDNLK